MAEERNPAASLAERILTLELQMRRLEADAESEKGTRSRVNAEVQRKLDRLDDRMRLVERQIWTGIGALAGLQVLMQIVFHFWPKV